MSGVHRGLRGVAGRAEDHARQRPLRAMPRDQDGGRGQGAENILEMWNP